MCVDCLGERIRTSRAMAGELRGASSPRTVESLRQQCKQLTKDIANASRPMKLATNASARRPRAFGITPHQERLVSAVYVLAGCEVDAAAQRLMSLRPDGANTLSFAQAERLVEDIFLSMPENFAAHVWDPPDAAMSRVCAAARRFLAQSKVFEWVGEQNLDHGVSPSSVDARDKYDEFMLVDSAASGQSSRSTVKSWARRWSRQWGVKRGKIKQAEPLDPDNVADKAALVVQAYCGLASAFFLQNGVQYCSPFSGPTFSYHLIGWSPKAARFPGSFYSPRFVEILCEFQRFLHNFWLIFCTKKAINVGPRSYLQSKQGYTLLAVAPLQ